MVVSQVDGYQNTGCYNLQCPGFVQIDGVLALGGSIEPVSIYNGEQREIQFIVKKVTLICLEFNKSLHED